MFCQKLHENERIWTPGGTPPWCPNPPVQLATIRLYPGAITRTTSSLPWCPGAGEGGEEGPKNQIPRSWVILLHNTESTIESNTVTRTIKYSLPKKQECIPVGCVPPAHWPSVGGVPAQGGCTCPGGCTYAGVTCPGTPPVNRMTDRCKNITLLQTSFAGGNNTNEYRK